MLSACIIATLSNAHFLEYTSQNMPGRKRKAEERELSKLEEGLGSLTPEQLRKELADVGEQAGPIDSSNK